jgi:hypothetical protein
MFGGDAGEDWVRFGEAVRDLGGGCSSDGWTILSPLSGAKARR